MSVGEVQQLAGCETRRPCWWRGEVMLIGDVRPLTGCESSRPCWRRGRRNVKMVKYDKWLAVKLVGLVGGGGEESQQVQYDHWLAVKRERLVKADGEKTSIGEVRPSVGDEN